MTLMIDDEFKCLAPPLSPDEHCTLEESIRANGCQEPLRVWNQTIIDGHRRHEICTRLQILFAVTPVVFENRNEVLAWICANHLKRDGITSQVRYYLIGKLYEFGKMTAPHVESTEDNTCERLCREHRTSLAMMCFYRRYAHAIDKLSTISPSLKPKILTGRIHASCRTIIKLSRHSPADVRRIDACLSATPNSVMRHSVLRELLPDKDIPKLILPSIPGVSVKDIPEHDPDAETLSLCLTIPSWVSAIKRARLAINPAAISRFACGRLQEELTRLQSVVDTMNLLLKENHP